MATKKTTTLIAIVMCVLFSVYIFSPAYKNIADLNSRLNFCQSNINDSIQVAENIDIISNSFMSTYFYNLTNYHFNNDDNSCCYVALQMILSYYNHFWNDSLVNEEFETSATNNYSATVSSPGTNDGLFNTLVAIGSSFGYTKTLHSSNEIKDILQEYLVQQPNISLSSWKIYTAFSQNPLQQITLSNGTSSTIGESYINAIKSYISNGIPVLTLLHENGVGHAAVAYAYDQENDQLIYNVGWKVNHDQSIFINENDYCVGYVVLMNLNEAHVHSTNFILNNQPTCACRLPNHIHAQYSYTKLNDAQHNKICYCGHVEHENHSFKADLTGKTFTCIYCYFKKFGISPPITIDP